MKIAFEKRASRDLLPKAFLQEGQLMMHVQLVMLFVFVAKVVWNFDDPHCYAHRWLLGFRKCVRPNDSAPDFPASCTLACRCCCSPCSLSLFCLRNLPQYRLGPQRLKLVATVFHSRQV